MELVEEYRRIRAELRDSFMIALPHVHADSSDLASSLLVLAFRELRAVVGFALLDYSGDFLLG